MKNVNFNPIFDTIQDFLSDDSKSSEMGEVIKKEFEYPIKKATFEDSPEYKKNRRLHKALEEFIRTERTFREEISNLMILCVYKQQKLSITSFSTNDYRYLTDFIEDLRALATSITELSANLESKILTIKVTDGQPIQNELTPTEIKNIFNALDQSMHPKTGSFKKKFLHFANLISKKNEFEIRIPEIFSDEQDSILQTLLRYRGNDSLSFYITNRTILPTQRGPRYILTLKEMVEHLPKGQFSADLLISNATKFCTDLNIMVPDPQVKKSFFEKLKEAFLNSSEDEYEFCLMSSLSSEDKPQPKKLYFSQKDGMIAYTVITPANKTIFDEKTKIRAPYPFNLDSLVPLREKLLKAISRKGDIESIPEFCEITHTTLEEAKSKNGSQPNSQSEPLTAKESKSNSRGGSQGSDFVEVTSEPDLESSALTGTDPVSFTEISPTSIGSDDGDKQNNQKSNNNFTSGVIPPPIPQHFRKKTTVNINNSLSELVSQPTTSFQTAENAPQTSKKLPPPRPLLPRKNPEVSAPNDANSNSVSEPVSPSTMAPPSTENELKTPKKPPAIPPTFVRRNTVVNLPTNDTNKSSVSTSQATTPSSSEPKVPPPRPSHARSQSTLFGTASSNSSSSSSTSSTTSSVISSGAPSVDRVRSMSAMFQVPPSPSTLTQNNGGTPGKLNPNRLVGVQVMMPMVPKKPIVPPTPKSNTPNN